MTMPRIRICFVLFSISVGWFGATAFVQLPSKGVVGSVVRVRDPYRPFVVALWARRNRLEDNIDEAGRRNAQGGAGETAAGAILGGLLLGPFGALFGASLGANMGAQRAVDRARQEEMERLGVTPDMLEMARECGAALERTMEGLQLTRDSYQTQKSFATRLERTMDLLYDQAKDALRDGREEQAKALLLEKNQVQDKLKRALMAAAEDRKRLQQMERNAEALEQRAMEIESLLNRSVGAKTLQDTATMGMLSLTDEDPLLRKFRDMGIN